MSSEIHTPGKVTKPADDRQRQFGYQLLPNVHLRHQSISSLPNTSFRLGAIRPTTGLPPLATVLSPNSVDMLTADDERDLFNPPDAVDTSLMHGGPQAIPLPPWSRYAYRAEIAGVDIKQPNSGTHEARQLSLECTKQGYGKCPWCVPAPDPREPSIKQ